MILTIDSSESFSFDYHLKVRKSILSIKDEFLTAAEYGNKKKLASSDAHLIPLNIRQFIGNYWCYLIPKLIPMINSLSDFRIEDNPDLVSQLISTSLHTKITLNQS